MVYPRVCGGTQIMPPRGRRRHGLSPRVRGNQAVDAVVRREAGSIPACAGEPQSQRGVARQPKVYPRVCGGTSEPENPAELDWGLSPRVRGNREKVHSAPHVSGSIPACAGEPMKWLPRLCGSSVYPRVCGGTGGGGGSGCAWPGLSPRVRGNPAGARKGKYSPGSIPACAGEPSLADPDIDYLEVYPRVCGGTKYRCQPLRPPNGLSPRVRGNLHQFGRIAGAGGSIPACAGEPSRAPQAASRVRVYPRVCGGTQPSRPRHRLSGGLSPRVRGNHQS